MRDSVAAVGRSVVEDTTECEKQLLVLGSVLRLRLRLRLPRRTRLRAPTRGTRALLPCSEPTPLLSRRQPLPMLLPLLMLMLTGATSPLRQRRGDASHPARQVRQLREQRAEADSDRRDRAGWMHCSRRRAAVVDS